MSRYVLSGTKSDPFALSAELEKVQLSEESLLSRIGEAPNQMEADLDMNSNSIINLPFPNSPLEPVRRRDLGTLLNTAVDETFQVKLVTPIEYGAVGDGVTDDTAAVQACLTSEAFTVIDRVYAVSSVTANNYVTCINNGKLLNISGSGTYTLTINSKWVGDIVVDCNGNEVSGVDFPEGLGYRQDANSVHVSNSTTSASLVFTAGIRAYGDDLHITNTFVENMTNTGNTNDSVPQGLVIGGLKVNITNTEFRDTRSNVVLTNAAKFHIGCIDIYNSEDNGLYAFGSEGTVGSLIYRGTEEPLVASGSHMTVGTVTTIGYCGSILRLQNNRYLDIGEIISTYPVTTPFEDIKDNVAIGLFNHRSSNVTTESVRIGRVTGDFYLSLFRTGSGTGVTNILAIDSMDVRLHWVNTTRDPNWDVTNWFSLAGVVQLNLNNFNINIIDVYDELTTSSSEYFRQQFATVPKESLFENIDVFIRNSDGTISTNGIYRGAGQSEFIKIVGARWQVNIGSTIYSREASAGERDSFITDDAPTTGYWRKGQRFTVNDYDGFNGNHTYICTTSGIAGAGATFAAIGEIITGSGSPVGVVTPTSLGQLYRDTGATAGSRLWMSYGSTNAFWEQL